MAHEDRIKANVTAVAGMTFVPTCPICGGRMQQVYDRNERRVFACDVCSTDLIVPITAWLIASNQREAKKRKL